MSALRWFFFICKLLVQGQFGMPMPPDLQAFHNILPNGLPAADMSQQLLGQHSGLPDWERAAAAAAAAACPPGEAPGQALHDFHCDVGSSIFSLPFSTLTCYQLRSISLESLQHERPSPHVKDGIFAHAYRYCTLGSIPGQTPRSQHCLAEAPQRARERRNFRVC